MNILAIDTTLSACSIAVLDTSGRRPEVRARFFEWRARGHAEVLAPAIKSSMREAGWKFDDLDTVAVTLGPGSFTGVRVGVACARGIALAGNIEIVGMTTMSAVLANMDEPAGEGRPLAVVLDARRGEIYAQLFSATHEPLSGPAALTPQAVIAMLPDTDCLLLGTAADGLAPLARAAGKRVSVAATLPVPDAAVFGIDAAHLDPSLMPPDPVYLRPADAKQQLRPSLLQTPD